MGNCFEFQEFCTENADFHEAGWVILQDGEIILPLGINVLNNAAAVLIAPDKGVLVKRNGKAVPLDELSEGLESLIASGMLKVNEQWVRQVTAERATYYATKRRNKGLAIAAFLDMVRKFPEKSFNLQCLGEGCAAGVGVRFLHDSYFELWGASRDVVHQTTVEQYLFSNVPFEEIARSVADTTLIEFHQKEDTL